ncbi:TetR/AcrR family transcriptional regulator [Nocardia salmonicida]|uniref:TetR/AcrR family transcriptional regulator n=1 Tax=Nocardia salmonicida TaxID=53431 RepID=UPI0007A3F887|nr:TetR/AcrR family transcriptional regulator [Nocardia salmonicida]
MPKLWSETIDEHRRAVRDSILDTTARLAIEHGVSSVTMSQVAEHAGIGRATLYKYFSDVGTILGAWHEQQVGNHLGQLMEAGAAEGDASQRLNILLSTYARVLRESRRHHDTDLGALVHHGGSHVVHAEQKLRQLMTDSIGAAAAIGAVRADVPAAELASYCLHALDAAVSLSSEEAVQRLLGFVRAGLDPV